MQYLKLAGILLCFMPFLACGSASTTRTTLAGTEAKLDSDGDGLSDQDEIETYKTNPDLADTDQDGLSDGEERFKHRSSPRAADTDGDGLNDGDEVARRTSPLLRDTDGDGMSDSEEVNQHESDPLNKDSDGDSVLDSVDLCPNAKGRVEYNGCSYSRSR